MSLDDKRTALLPEEKLGPCVRLTAEERGKNNLPDIVACFHHRDAEYGRPRPLELSGAP